MKIGILYSSSKEYPALVSDFVQGVRSASQSRDNSELSFIMESVGNGGLEKEVFEKAEKLLLIESVDILVAYIDLKVLPLLKPLVYSTGKLLIVVNAGANYPENWVPQSNIIFLTLGHSFQCWLTGGLAKDKSAALATGFFDAGFLHISALTKNLFANNGKLIYNYVNRDQNKTFSLAGFTDHLENNKEINNIIAVYDLHSGEQFYNRLLEYPDASRLDLFVSQMMLEDRLLKGRQFPFDLEGHTSYIPMVNTKDEFSVFLSTVKSDTHSFALQGWETGLLLDQVSQHCKGFIEDGEKIIDHLKELKLESPRGNLIFDAETNYFIGPSYFVSKKAGQTGYDYKLATYAEDEWKKFSATPLQGVNSGWTNTYLCY